MLPGVPTPRESDPPTIPGLVGESFAMQALRREIATLAPFPVNCATLRGDLLLSHLCSYRARHVPEYPNPVQLR
jgi:hypothetical protein